ncbi:hypothetical protein NDU88_004928 [Pleurodeles waltl]|uniref:Uncharacterized protein n=1 Tax=Pleurodeles waltl TaxID=8319 RepID=A0AAV7NNQ9_PLEWA|nr:hypothetical protein NDU88_004928 [Pleurodeles waltl]
MPTHFILTAHRPGEPVSDGHNENPGREDYVVEDCGAAAEAVEDWRKEEDRNRKPGGHLHHESPATFLEECGLLKYALVSGSDTGGLGRNQGKQGNQGTS